MILRTAVDSYLSIGVHNATTQVTAILRFPTMRTSNIDISVTVCVQHYMLTFHSKNTSQLSIKKFKPPLQVIFLFSAKKKSVIKFLAAFTYLSTIPTVQDNMKSQNGSV